MLGTTPMTICTIFKPADRAVEVYIQIFEYMENYVNRAQHILIVGDFNIPELVGCCLGYRTTKLFRKYKNFISFINNFKSATISQMPVRKSLVLF